MWILFAFATSIFWGLTYVFDGEIYKKISVPTSIAFSCLVAFLVMLAISYFSGQLKTDIVTAVTDKKLLFYVITATVTFVLAELLIGLPISAKNATLSGLIEISYPIFIAIFAYMFFKENQINTGTVLGGLMVFVGVFVIYFFNR